MVFIDTTRPDRELRPGWDLWEVTSFTSGKSRKGDAMFTVKLARVSDLNEQIQDTIMLEGLGWGLGKQKLGAFLPPGFKGDVDPIGFTGRRVWVETGIETYKDKNGADRQSLKPVPSGKHAGYQQENDPPPGMTAPAPAAEDPFSVF